MEFSLSSEQQALQENVRRLLATHSAARDMFTTDGPSSARDLWGRLNDAGLSTLGLRLEELDLESTAIEQMLVAEEIGRAAAPSPFVGLATATSILARSSRTEAGQLLEQVLDGRIVVAALPSAFGGTVAVKALGEGGDTTLHGEVLLVPGGAWADTVLVAAEANGSPAIYAVDVGAPGCVVQPTPSIDPGAGLAKLGLDSAAATPVLETEAEDAIQHATILAMLLTAAETTGVAHSALHLAADYARTRTQFGHPIGSFQAVKHKLSDMVVAVENARSACYGAAWKLHDNEPDAALYVHMAKAVAAESGPHVAADALQLHGGIGCTFEHDIHLYLRRAKTGQLLYGDANEHLDYLASAFLEDGETTR
ncbi:acyl-CoA dehydrogenase family protein [Streptomyces gardneri]|nr:acyl-CoA dehydrogenase family protein [Streptomyces gardneri]